MDLFLPGRHSRVKVHLYAAAHAVQNEFSDERHSEHRHFFTVLHASDITRYYIPDFSSNRLFCHGLFLANFLLYFRDLFPGVRDIVDYVHVVDDHPGCAYAAERNDENAPVFVACFMASDSFGRSASDDHENQSIILLN